MPDSPPLSGHYGLGLANAELMRRHRKTALWTGCLYLGNLSNLLSGLGMVIALAGYGQLWLPSIAVFAGGQALLVVGTVGVQQRSPSPWRHTLSLLGLYGLLAGWDFLAIAIALPIVILGMVSGPLALGGVVAAAISLGLYCLETLLGLDLPGVSGLETIWQVGFALLALVMFGLVLVWRWRHPDWDIAAAVTLNRALRRRLKRAIIRAFPEQHNGSR